MPEKAQEFLLMPIADQLLSEMQDICTADCERVLPFRRGALTEDKDEVENYWLRLEPKGMEEPKDRRTLRMEAYDKPCLVGFAVDKDHHCPLFTFEPVVKNFSDFLWIIKRVAAFRKREAAMERREKAARDETAKHSRRNPTKTDAP